MSLAFPGSSCDFHLGHHCPQVFVMRPQWGKNILLRGHLGAMVLLECSLFTRGFIWLPQRTELINSTHAEWISSPCQAHWKHQLLACFPHSDGGHDVFLNWPHIPRSKERFPWCAAPPKHLAILPLLGYLSALMSQHSGEGRSSFLGLARTPSLQPSLSETFTELGGLTICWENYRNTLKLCLQTL